MQTYLANLDLTELWRDSDYYTSPDEITGERVNEAEKRLGYKLPKSYIELIKNKNGGSPANDCFRTEMPTSWAKDHIAITSIKGLGGNWGIDSESFGSDDAIEEWGYPKIGIVICDCPSAGHDVVMLDYRKNGQAGEPEIVHIETECDEPMITFLAKDFETFIKGLESSENFDFE